MKRSAMQTCGACILAVILGGCGTLYKLDVTAYNDPNYEIENQYVVLSANPKIPLGSPDFEQYAEQLERALSDKGYQRVSGDELDQAAIAVYLYVGISEPSKRYHEVSQAVRETEYDTTSAREAQTVSAGQGSGGSSGGQATAQVRSYEPPRTSVLAGYEEQQFATTVYKKYMTVQAIDLRRYDRERQQFGQERAVPREIWSVEVETTGQPSNLAEVVPIMIAAAKPFIATSTETVRVSIGESDARIDAIRAAK